MQQEGQQNDSKPISAELVLRDKCDTGAILEMWKISVNLCLSTQLGVRQFSLFFLHSDACFRPWFVPLIEASQGARGVLHENNRYKSAICLNISWIGSHSCIKLEYPDDAPNTLDIWFNMSVGKLILVRSFEIWKKTILHWNNGQRDNVTAPDALQAIVNLVAWLRWTTNGIKFVS